MLIQNNKITELPIEFSNFKKIIEFGFDWFVYCYPPLRKIIKKPMQNYVFKKLALFCEEMKRSNIYTINLLNFIVNMSYDNINFN